MTLLKKFIFWNYSRETSVYVVFCLLIVAFIFLTPRSWFDRSEVVATQTSRLIVQEKDYSPDPDVLERKVKELSGRPEAQIVALKERKNGNGETIYEIDIR